MSSGGSILDSIQGLFSSGGGAREARADDRDPARDRLERIEQIVSGVQMAADALPDSLSELSRESTEAAATVLEAARNRVPGDEDESETTGRAREDAVEAVSRGVDVLEELHYRLLRIEVHPEVQTEEEREDAAERARESVRRAREVADALAESTPA